MPMAPTTAKAAVVEMKILGTVMLKLLREVETKRYAGLTGQRKA